MNEEKINKMLERLFSDEMDIVFNSVPFGNSRFQNDKFSGEKQCPARARRHYLLQLSSKRDALHESHLMIRKTKLQIGKIQKKLSQLTITTPLTDQQDYKKQKTQLKLEQLQYRLKKHQTLINDAFEEVSFFFSELDKLPEYSREGFENEENQYWKKRLTEMIESQMLTTGSPHLGEIVSLSKMGVLVEWKIIEDNNGNAKRVLLIGEINSKNPVLNKTVPSDLLMGEEANES